MKYIAYSFMKVVIPEYVCVSTCVCTRFRYKMYFSLQVVAKIFNLFL